MTIFGILLGSLVYFGLLILVLIDFVLIKGKAKKLLEEFLEEEEKKGTADPKLLEFEYEKCQEMLIHYDNMNWQIGSILIGSNIVALGLSLSAGEYPLFLGLSVFGMLSMYFWALWYFRHMALYNLRNDRMYVIEKKLGLRQNLMIGEIKRNAPRHRWLGITSGHTLTLFLTIFLATIWYLTIWLI